MSLEEKFRPWVIVLALIPPLLWARLWVTVQVWQWHVVPLGVRPIDYGTALALSCALDTGAAIYKKSDTHTPLKLLVMVICQPTFVLLIGWVTL